VFVVIVLLVVAIVSWSKVASTSFFEMAEVPNISCPTSSMSAMCASETVVVAVLGLAVDVPTDIVAVAFNLKLC